MKKRLMLLLVLSQLPFLALAGEGLTAAAPPCAGLPPLSSIQGPPGLCSGTQHTYSINPVPGAFSYSWTLPGGWSGSSTTNTIHITAGAVAGTLSVTATDSCGNTSPVQTLYVAAAPSPTGSLSIVPSPLCAGQSCTVTALAGSGSAPYAFNWSMGAMTSAITYTPAWYDTDSLTITDMNGCTVVLPLVLPFIPQLSVSATSTLVCAGQSTTLTANASGGALPYTYSWVGGNNPTVVLPSPFPGTYSLTVTDDNGCTNSIHFPLDAAPNPTVTISATKDTICRDEQDTLTATGADYYVWNIGTTSPDVILQGSSTMDYIVMGTDWNGCVGLDTVRITVDTTCSYVWPGDANNDGLANNLDLLELGLQYGQTGPARSITSYPWQRLPAPAWTGTVSSGYNLSHADCNGDGSIDQNDTLAILTNYGLTHAKPLPELSNVNPQLNIICDQSLLLKGQWGSASITLGDAAQALGNVYGVAFTINIDNNLIEQDSVYVTFDTSFLSNGSLMLGVRHLDFSNNALSVGLTRTDHQNSGGFGKIATLHYKISSNLSVDAPLNLSLLNATLSSAAGTMDPLSTGTSSVATLGASVGMNETVSGVKMTVFPNPALGRVQVVSTTVFDQIQIMDMTGRLVHAETASGTQHIVQVEALPAGVYFINIRKNARVLQQKKLLILHQN